jgi:hypothetical protein
LIRAARTTPVAVITAATTASVTVLSFKNEKTEMNIGHVEDSVKGPPLYMDFIFGFYRTRAIPG